jgi:hypothetical protein
MMPLRQPVRRSLGEGGGFGAQAPLSAVVPLARRRIVSGIPCRDLGLLWRDAWPLLERAATRTNGGTEDEVVQTLLQGDAQLWGVFDGDVMIAAVTTQITLIGEKGCRLWLVGGSRMAEWAADFLAKVEPWARSLGCTHVWGTQSRAGWQRIVRLFGGEPVIVDGKASWMRRF